MWKHVYKVFELIFGCIASPRFACLSLTKIVSSASNWLHKKDGSKLVYEIWQAWRTVGSQLPQYTVQWCGFSKWKPDFHSIPCNRGLPYASPCASNRFCELWVNQLELVRLSVILESNYKEKRRLSDTISARIMESQDYEHYRNLTLMFFLEKLVDKGGKYHRMSNEPWPFSQYNNYCMSRK